MSIKKRLKVVFVFFVVSMFFSLVDRVQAEVLDCGGVACVDDNQIGTKEVWPTQVYELKYGAWSGLSEDGMICDKCGSIYGSCSSGKFCTDSVGGGCCVDSGSNIALNTLVDKDINAIACDSEKNKCKTSWDCSLGSSCNSGCCKPGFVVDNDLNDAIAYKFGSWNVIDTAFFPFNSAQAKEACSDLNELKYGAWSGLSEDGMFCDKCGGIYGGCGDGKSCTDSVGGGCCVSSNGNIASDPVNTVEDKFGSWNGLASESEDWRYNNCKVVNPGNNTLTCLCLATNNSGISKKVTVFKTIDYTKLTKLTNVQIDKYNSAVDYLYLLSATNRLFDTKNGEKLYLLDKSIYSFEGDGAGYYLLDFSLDKPFTKLTSLSSLDLTKYNLQLTAMAWSSDLLASRDMIINDYTNSILNDTQIDIINNDYASLANKFLEGVYLNNYTAVNQVGRAICQNTCGTNAVCGDGSACNNGCCASGYVLDDSKSAISFITDLRNVISGCNYLFSLSYCSALVKNNLLDSYLIKQNVVLAGQTKEFISEYVYSNGLLTNETGLDLKTFIANLEQVLDNSYGKSLNELYIDVRDNAPRDDHSHDGGGRILGVKLKNDNLFFNNFIWQFLRNFK